MKLMTSVLAVAIMTVAAWAQNPDAIDNTRSTVKPVQQTKTNLQDTLVLRASVNDMKQRLDALESAQGQPPPFSSSTTTNEPPDPLSP